MLTGMRKYISEEAGHNLVLRVLSYSLKFKWLVKVINNLAYKNIWKDKNMLFLWKGSLAKSHFWDFFVDLLLQEWFIFSGFFGATYRKVLFCGLNLHLNKLAE